MSSLDLAVIGNCMSAALIDRRAQIVWGCFPRIDGDPRLLCPAGRGGGPVTESMRSVAFSPSSWKA